jgi:AraC-like DNA-binding protein
MGPQSPITDLRVLERRFPVRSVARKNLILPLERLRPQIRFAHESPDVSIAARIVYDFCLAIFRSARGSMLLEGVEHAVEPGRIYIMPPFERHSFAFEPGTDQTHVAVHFDLAPDFPDGSQIDDRLAYSVRLTDRVALPANGIPTGIPDVYAAAVDIVAMFQRRTILSRVQADAGLFQLIAASLVQSCDAGADPSRVRSTRGASVIDRVLAHIDSHLADPFTITDLAAIGAVSNAHLTRLFRQELGYAPMGYLTKRRMIKARELLRDERLSIKEIAARVGYKDPHHFTRVFRQFDGLSPSQHRISAGPR